MGEEASAWKSRVKQFYGKRARQGSPGACCQGEPAERLSLLGYEEEEVEGLPPDLAGFSMGCGNPVGASDAEQGETVVDLGSGGGLDSFIAARRVGTTGRVVGVDFEEGMVSKARGNAERLGLRNVAFRVGDIEDVPIQSSSADLVISNCAIVLAPNKQRVFEEAFRVLRPGGRMVISDIVSEKPLPEYVRRDQELVSSCLGGAVTEQKYLRLIHRAGFEPAQVLSRKFFSFTPREEEIRWQSITVKAVKPLSLQGESAGSPRPGPR